MKKKKMTQIASVLGIVAVLAIIGFGFAACGGDDDNTGGNGGNNGGTTYAIGDTGPGGGIVFYDKGSVSDGWRYLEAAPTNQATSITWSLGHYNLGVLNGSIGAGKANTAAIIAATSTDTASNNAAKAAVAYTGGGKNDWFLPSIHELSEMYKARTHLGISSGEFWSSFYQSGYNSYAFTLNFDNGETGGGTTYPYNNIIDVYAVRAIRAF